MKPNNKISILTLSIAIVLGVVVISWLDTVEEHDHKDYKVQWANTLKSTTFTICGDTAVVRYNGIHINYVPKHLRKIINKEEE